MARITPKRKAGLIFTASTTSVTTWLGAPRITGETARIEIDRSMAAQMLRKSRNEKRKISDDNSKAGE